MMYKKNFVAAIKVGGKILRETNERVELPFGSEYSILLKNLDSVRSQARISVDGEDATGWLILQPNSTLDVERFVKDLDRGNRFKFIERTDRIEQHRGIKAEDGLIRIEFKREKVYELPKVVEHHTYHHHDYWYYPRPYVYPASGWNFCGTLNGSNASLGQTTLTSSLGSSSRGTLLSAPVAAMNMMRSADSFNQSEAGITVPGSVSNQKFTTVAGFETEQSEVIVLHLVGRKGTASIPVAKTVDYRPLCETCGKKNKATSKFCVECGTSLEKV